MTQAAFSFPVLPSYAAEDFFVTDSNRLAREWVARWPDASNHALLITGPEASGKTHLAQLFLAEKPAFEIAPLQLGSRTADKWFASPGVLVIDGIERVRDESALVALINQAKSSQRKLLFTMRQDFTPKLPDLASRLSSLTRVAIESPDDTLVAAIFQKLFADRQLRIAPETVVYLLKRCERSYAGITSIIQRIDSEALKRQRSVTAPFVKEILSEEG